MKSLGAAKFGVEAKFFCSAVLRIEKSEGLPRTWRGMDRGCLEERFNFPVGALSINNTPFARYSEHRTFLDGVEARLIPVMEKDLRLRLERMWRDGTLPLNGGRISRRQFSDRIGAVKIMCKSTAPAWFLRALDDFDNELAKQGATIWDGKVDEVERLLIDLHGRKELPLNPKGGLNKARIFSTVYQEEPYAIQYALTRCKRLRALLERYDDVVRKDGFYVKSKYLPVLPKLDELLHRKTLALVDGRTINVQALAKELGIPTGSMRNSAPLRKAIEDRQAQIDEELRHGQTIRSFRLGGADRLNLGKVPFCKAHGRAYDFSRLSEFYGLEFAEKIGTAFIIIAERMADARVKYHRVLHFLNWIAQTEPIKETVAEQLRGGKAIPPVELENALLTYRQLPFATRTGKIPGIGVLLDLIELGILPRIAVRLNAMNRRSTGRLTSPRPSLAEAAPRTDSGGQAALNTGEVDAIERITRDCSIAADVALALKGDGDIRAFASSIARERMVRTDLPAGLPESIRILCEERIEALKVSAAAVFEEWHGLYMRGQAILAQKKDAESDILTMFKRIKVAPGSGESISLIRKVFPAGNPSEAFANILVIIHGLYGATCPLKNEESSFWARRYRQCEASGDREWVQGHLAPTRSAVAAAALLYLCESGANPSTATAVRHDSIRPSSLPGHTQIVSYKARAGGKPIYADLPDEIGGSTCAAKALKVLGDVTKRLNLASDHDPLFRFHEGGAGVVNLSCLHLLEETRKIAARSPRLCGLNVMPSMIRSTVLLKAQLANHKTLGIAQRIADHDNQSTTWGYVNRLGYRLILDERIREYMEVIQVISVEFSHDANARHRLGIAEADWNGASARMEQSGLGIFCKDRFSGAQPDFPTGERCQALDRCHTCVNRVVIATVPTVAAMLLWKEAIELSEERWASENKNIDRYHSVWVPALVFLIVVLEEKMSRGELAPIKQRAVDLVKDLKARRGFRLPEIY